MKKYSLPVLIFLSCFFFSVSIKAQLKAGFTISASAGCSPLTENFTNTSTGGSGPYTYTWDFGDGDSSTSASTGYIYGYVYSTTSYKIKLIVRDANNDTSSATKSIEVLPSPRPDLGPDQRGCAGHSLILTTGLPHEPIVDWTWITGTDTNRNVVHGDTIYITNSGTYIVKVLNSYGCAGMDTANIYFNPLVKANKTDSTVCLGATVTLRAGIGGPGATYLWLDLIHNNSVLSTAPTFSFTASLTYDKGADFEVVIKQTVNGFTCADTGYYNITVNTATQPKLYKLPSLCINSPAFQLYAGPPYVDPAHGGGTWTYPKNPSAILNGFLYPAIMGITAGDSSLGWLHYTFFNVYDCMIEDSIKIYIYGLPPVSAGPDTEICNKNGKYLLSNAYVSPPGGNWFTMSGTPSSAVTYSKNRDSVFFNPNASGIADTIYGVIYSYTAPAPSQCSNTDTVFIEVNSKCVSGIYQGINQILNLSIFPNPFSATTTLQYNLLMPSKITISLFDITGKQISIITNETEAPGAYQFEINPEEYHLTPGVYLLKFMTDDGYISRQIVKW